VHIEVLWNARLSPEAEDETVATLTFALDPGLAEIGVTYAFISPLYTKNMYTINIILYT